MVKQKNKPVGSAKPKGSKQLVFPTTNSMSDNDNIIHSVDIQENFSELGEFQEKFTPKHAKSVELSSSFHRLGLHTKANRIEQCGSYLKFYHDIDSFGVIDNVGKLHYANFCRERLCPMCAWRKSLKAFAQVSQVMDIMPKDKRFIFLTLTIPNCTPNTLQETVSALFKSWDRLCHNKRFKGQIKGFIRVLEVTYNKKSKTFHPHFHCILCVDRDYFAGRNYISQKEYLDMWRKACNDYSITQVDIRVIRDLSNSSAISDDTVALKKAIAETTKYTTKDTDFLGLSSDNETDMVVSVLSVALKGRRLLHFGGLFKQLAAELKLEDIEQADLVHIDDSINPAVAHAIVSYGWSCGAYKIMNVEIEKVGD